MSLINGGGLGIKGRFGKSLNVTEADGRMSFLVTY